MEPRQRQVYGLVSSLVFMSLVMGFDLLLELICARLPLAVYGVAGALGALFGGTFAGWLAGGGWGRKALRALATTGCAMGLLGAAALTFAQPPWSSHCGFRYCGRALGMGLGRSPFPVGIPSCEHLHMCANEFTFNEAEWRDYDALILKRDCEPP
jgi:hypothetical protein